MKIRLSANNGLTRYHLSVGKRDWLFFTLSDRWLFARW